MGGGGGRGESLVKVHLYRNMTGKVLAKTDLKRKGGGGRRVLGQASFTWNYDRERFWWEEKMGGWVGGALGQG